MPKLSDKNPFDQKSFSDLSESLINFTLSVSDIVIVYISGLLVVIGALLNILPSTFWAQLILTCLIVSGSLIVYAVIYAIQFPYEVQSKNKMGRLRAITLIRGSSRLMGISWVLILVLTPALIALIIFA